MAYAASVLVLEMFAAVYVSIYGIGGDADLSGARVGAYLALLLHALACYGALQTARDGRLLSMLIYLVFYVLFLSHLVRHEDLYEFFYRNAGRDEGGLVVVAIYNGAFVLHTWIPALRGFSALRERKRERRRERRRERLQRR